MPYTPELEELIKKVEATRPERVERKKRGEEVPFLDLDERKERLRFHPDFQEDGRRELLAYDPAIHCNQAVPLVARPVPPQRPSQVDYTQTMGRYYVQEENQAQGVRGVPRGTAKDLRVVALEYRAADAYYNSNIGEAGRSHSRTPPAINNGSWDVKHVLGTVPVEADGSAYFEVPARTPVYFQLLDEHHMELRRMRSFISFQPGEVRACVGCHETKAVAPPPGLRLTPEGEWKWAGWRAEVAANRTIVVRR